MINIKTLSFLFVVFTFNFDSYDPLNHERGRATALVNFAPVFGTDNYSFNVLEQIALNSSVGQVTATDNDDDTLTYSITSGNTNKALKINSSSGLITVAKQLACNTQNQYTLKIKVTDEGGLSDEALVVINVDAVISTPGFDSITWSTAKSQPYTVSESQGEVVNGKLYTFGGFDSQKSTFTPTSRAYRFDPLLNTWTSIAAMPPMNGTNYGGVTHAGFTTDHTDIYFAGGYTSNSTGTGQKFGTKEVWKYIVEENRYVRLPDLPIAIAAGQLEYLAGKLHHVSGTNASRTLDLGDHYVLNLDSLSKGWKKLAPLPNPRQHGGSVVYERKIYFIGGQWGHDGKLVAQKDVHSYDPVTNAWTKLADLPVPAGAKGRGHISSAAIVVGKNIIVLAGETVHSTSRTNMVSAYTPATNTWKNLTPLPLARHSGVAANLGGIIYYTGGSKTSTTYKGIPLIQEVLSLTLMNADIDQALFTLVSGDTIDLEKLHTKNINIVANTNPVKVGSVQFNLSGPVTVNITESRAPYAFFGDNNNGDYYAWTPPLGNYTLKVTPYSGSGATGRAGLVKTYNFTVINSAVQNVTLLPVADAFVRNGSYANNNYGSDTILEVKTITSSGFTRHAYLKFSVSGISSVTSATLRLYGYAATNSTAGINLSVFGVNDDSWQENQIHFNNAPSPGSLLSSAGITNLAKYYDFDVTDFVKAQLAGNNLVSLLVKDLKNSDVKFVFNSRENLNYVPQLIIGDIGQNKPPVTKISNVGDTALSLIEYVKTPVSQPKNRKIKTRVYPNPIYKKLTVEIAKDYKVSYDLQIVDPVGKIYELGKSHLNPGVHNIEVDISKISLIRGIYFLRIQYDTGQTEIIKLLAQ